MTISFFTYYRNLRSYPEDEFIIISGDYVKKVKVSYTELLPALYRCEQRYVHLLRKLVKDESYYEKSVARLKAQAKVAQHL